MKQQQHDIEWKENSWPFATAELQNTISVDKGLGLLLLKASKQNTIMSYMLLREYRKSLKYSITCSKESYM